MEKVTGQQVDIGQMSKIVHSDLFVWPMLREQM